MVTRAFAAETCVYNDAPKANARSFRLRTVSRFGMFRLRGLRRLLTTLEVAMNDVWTDDEDWVLQRAPVVGPPKHAAGGATCKQARNTHRAAKHARKAIRASHGQQTLRRRRR